MGIKLDRDKFWNLYRKSFEGYGPITQATVDALNADLDAFENETRIHGIAQYSYVLATEYHETGINGNHFVPVKEGRNRVGSKGRANQDRYWLSGFFGRGKVQTTWEDKYRALGKLLGVGDMFVKNPDLLLTYHWAYEAMIAGMTAGIYRKDNKGKFTLDRMLQGDNATLTQYCAARQIINGDMRKNGLLIAGYAEKFEHILTASQVATDTPLPAAPTGEHSDESSSSTEEEAPAPSPTPPTTTTGEAPLAGGLTQSPSIWDRMGGYQDKVERIKSLGQSLSPISFGSKLTTVSNMTGGWGTLILGFLTNNWIYMLVGFGLIVAGIWYLTHSKNRSNQRIVAFAGGSPEAQTQSQTVVVK